MLIKRRIFKKNYKLNKNSRKLQINNKSKIAAQKKNYTSKKIKKKTHKKKVHANFLEILYWNQLSVEDSIKEHVAARKDIKTFAELYNAPLSDDASQNLQGKYLPAKIWASMTKHERRAHTEKWKELAKKNIKFIKVDPSSNQRLKLKLYFLNYKNRRLLNIMNESAKKQYLKKLIKSAKFLLKTPSKNITESKDILPYKKIVSNIAQKNFMNFRNIRINRPSTGRRAILGQKKL